jgi:hypothetical protein
MVDYSKWDNFQYSDDEEDNAGDQSKQQQERKGLLVGNEASITADRHGNLHELKERVLGHIRKWMAETEVLVAASAAAAGSEEEHKSSSGAELEMRKSFTSEDAALMTEWVTTNHFWAPHVDCCFRYEALIRLSTTHPTLMEHSDRWVDALLSVGRSMTQSSDPAVLADVRVLYVAVNTLVASQQYGGLVRLMEMICTPKDDDARAVRRRFVAQEFMKEAYMKHILGPVQFDDEDVTERGLCPQGCAIL